MLKTILSRRQPQAEELNIEEQADFRARMNTTEQIFNLRILCETLPCPLRLQEGFWQGMARRPEWCSVLFQKYSWSSTRMFTPTLLNVFLERIMREVLDDHEGSVSIGGRLITNFCFADDTVVNTKEEEADVMVDHLDTTTTRYNIEISNRKERKTEEEMGRQYKMDSNGVWRFPECGGRQGNVERYCCNVVCGVATTVKVKGLKWEEVRLLLVVLVVVRNVYYRICTTADHKHDKIHTFSNTHTTRKRSAVTSIRKRQKEICWRNPGAETFMRKSKWSEVGLAIEKKPSRKKSDYCKNNKMLI